MANGTTIHFTKPPISHYLYKYHRKNDERPFGTDVDIVCQGGYIPVHSFVLMAGSAMLKEHIMDQSRSEREQMTIHLPDFHINDVTPVIHLFYTGKCLVQRRAFDTVWEILESLGVPTAGMTFGNPSPEDLQHKCAIRRYFDCGDDDELFDDEEEELPQPPIIGPSEKIVIQHTSQQQHYTTTSAASSSLPGPSNFPKNHSLSFEYSESVSGSSSSSSNQNNINTNHGQEALPQKKPQEARPAKSVKVVREEGGIKLVHEQGNQQESTNSIDEGQVSEDKNTSQNSGAGSSSSQGSNTNNVRSTNEAPLQMKAQTKAIPSKSVKVVREGGGIKLGYKQNDDKSREEEKAKERVSATSQGKDDDGNVQVNVEDNIVVTSNLKNRLFNKSDQESDKNDSNNSPTKNDDKKNDKGKKDEAPKTKNTKKAAKKRKSSSHKSPKSKKSKQQKQNGPAKKAQTAVTDSGIPVAAQQPKKRGRPPKHAT